MEFIDLKSQYRRIHDSVDQRIQAVLEHGQFVLGPEVAEVEQRLSEFVGSSNCIAVASGTDALLIALMAYGIESGDEVITSPFSFIAAAETIALLGARPVFVDIDRLTYNLDPELVDAAVTERTKAILPVSLYGQCANMDRLNEIGKLHELPVIEDGAQSFGATYKGRRSCGLSDCGITSFFPSKPLGCYGEGGAIFTNDDDYANVVRQLRVHGEDRRYHHCRIGINGRMDSIQAAIVLSKLEIFDDEVEARGRIGAIYTEMIQEAFNDAEPVKRVRAPTIENFNESVFAQYTVSVPDRERVIAGMKKYGVPTAVHYPVPLYRQPIFEWLKQNPSDFPNSETAAAEVMSLPMHPYLTQDEQSEIVSALRNSVLS